MMTTPDIIIAVTTEARWAPETCRSSGPGGQSVNTTDSAVRITHLPTGTVVSCQNEKSQLQNRESAMRVLRARLHQVAADAAAAEAHDARASQVRTVDRSERIRTYNFPENRIADHRTGYKAYNLDQVLDGDLGPVIRSAIDAKLTSASLEHALYEEGGRAYLLFRSQDAPRVADCFDSLATQAREAADRAAERVREQAREIDHGDRDREPLEQRAQRARESAEAISGAEAPERDLGRGAQRREERSK